MKARVYVSFKTSVLDPQGQTIQSALNGLGHRSITGVRQGKFFEIELSFWTA
jgi:phosphoribosylformylglycinamidine synthase PurS subunit